MGMFKYLMNGPQYQCSYVSARGSFQEEKINSKAITNSTEDMLSTHIAVIGDYVASCITFSYPNRVPAGNKYHVTKSRTCLVNRVRAIPLSAWHVLEW